MIQIKDTLISEDILEKEFVCNISKCKGICCVEGDSGAPLNKDELPIFDEIYPKIKSYMRAEGIAAIEKQGLYHKDWDDEYVTPLVSDKNPECAYVVFEQNGTASCSIEKAYNDGIIDYKKPISCHLYPIRLKKYSSFTAVNYNYWPICDDACSLGKELKVPVFKFLKEPLEREFGKEWYTKLEEISKSY